VVLQLHVLALAEQRHQGVDDGLDQGGFDGHGGGASYWWDRMPAQGRTDRDPGNREENAVSAP
jgi:hypothetical protein